METVVALDRGAGCGTVGLKGSTSTFWCRSLSYPCERVLLEKLPPFPFQFDLPGRFGGVVELVLGVQDPWIDD